MKLLNLNKDEKVAVGGAFAAAAGASLCCILPVVSIAFGVGAFAAAAYFEALRPYLLATAVAALGYSGYRVFFGKKECISGEKCSTAAYRGRAKIFLLFAALATALVAAFPLYSGYVIAAIGGPSNARSDVGQAADDSGDRTAGPVVPQAVLPALKQRTITISVTGMTCEGCASHLDAVLKNIEGIVSVEASYPKKNVEVAYEPEKVSVARIRQEIRGAGYEPQ